MGREMGLRAGGWRNVVPLLSLKHNRCKAPTHYLKHMLNNFWGSCSWFGALDSGITLVAGFCHF